MIDHYLKGEQLDQQAELDLPHVYIEPLEIEDEKTSEIGRVETPRASVDWRKRNFAEVEVSLSIEEAMCEAKRCLRCDLEFTQPKKIDESLVIAGGN